MSTLNTDIAIIGAGPSGLFCAFQAGMLGMKSVIIDALAAPGGQCHALYPDKPIYDIPSQPEITGQALIDALLLQNQPFAPNYLLGQQVTMVEGDAGNFRLKTSLGQEITAKAIIISVGSGLFMPNRPPLAEIELYEGRSVFYHVSDKQKFNDATIAIAGGGDSAIDWAVALGPQAKKIYVIHRRDKFRAMEHSLQKMMALVAAGKIELITPYQLHSLNGENGLLREVVLTDLDNNKRTLEAQYLLAFFGLKTELGPLETWGLESHKNHLAVAAHNMMTSKAGIFAIGDISTYPGKLKLILTGFAEGALACHNAYNFVFPNKALHFEYSTTKGLKS
jgi:thioredoxin reductase (NADPH)